MISTVAMPPARKTLQALAPKHVRGVALLMSLIALIAMSLTAMALLRSVDTGNVIAGNLAFRQSAVQAVDLGMEAAFTAVQSAASLAALNANASDKTYYATMFAQEPSELTTTTTPAVDWRNLAVATTANGGAYEIRYVVDRLCSTTAVTEETAPDLCYVTKKSPKCDSHDPNKMEECSIPQGIYYRATIRVSGPRNTVGWAQSTFIRY